MFDNYLMEEALGLFMTDIGEYDIYTKHKDVNGNISCAIDYDFDDNPTKEGYRDKNGIWNGLIRYKGKLYRERCEALVMRDNEHVLISFKDDSYKLPGGSTEYPLSISEQLYNECKEESRVLIKNPKYILTYIDNRVSKWVKDKIPPKYRWVGTITHVFTAEYDGKYTGYINKLDRDDTMAKAKWCNINSEKLNILKNEHKYALSKYK